MRSCQLCGCASWGQVGNLAELLQRKGSSAAEWRLPDMIQIEDYRRCDGCGSLAQQTFIEDLPGLTQLPPLQAGSVSLWDKYAKNLVYGRFGVDPHEPEPETRLERLVAYLLTSPHYTPNAANGMQSLVGTAREIEQAMAEGWRQVGWSTHAKVFTDRGDFMSWWIQGFEMAVKEVCGLEPYLHLSKSNAEGLALNFVRWMEQTP